MALQQPGPQTHSHPLPRPSAHPAEQELRLQFLQRRERWIADLVADLDDHNAYELLKRLTDVYRLHLFDVVMQYRAIFSDDGGGQVCERAADAGPGAGG